jgi:hypothetical protein
MADVERQHQERTQTQTQNSSGQAERRAVYPTFAPLAAEPSDSEEEPQEQPPGQLGPDIEVLANLVDSSMKSYSRLLTQNKYPKPRRLAEGRAAEPVRDFVVSNVAQRGVFEFVCPRTGGALHLEAYGEVAALANNWVVQRCVHVRPPASPLFPLMGRCLSLLGSLRLTLLRGSPEQVAHSLADRGVELLTVACCGPEDLSFLADVVEKQPEHGRLKQIVVAVDQAREDRPDGVDPRVQEWALPLDLNPWWPHAEGSAEERALVELVKCAQGQCEHERCVFKNRELAFVYHEASLWKLPAWLSRKQCAAAVTDGDVLLRANLTLYRECGDTRQLLTRVMPTVAAAREANAFYTAKARPGESRVYEPLVGPAPADPDAMEIEDDEKLDVPSQCFFPGLRVVLLVPYGQLRAGSLGVVAALGETEVKVQFDRTEEVVGVGPVMASFPPRDQQVTLIPLQAAFAVDADWLPYCEVGESIACGLDPSQMRDLCSSLLSATHILWTPEVVPQARDDQFFASYLCQD